MDAYDLLVQHLGNAAASGTAAPSARVEDEAARIKDLPRAEYDAPGVQAHALAWATERWGKPGAPMQIRPIQALALFVCHLNGGGFLPVGTGHGKELISRLAADAVGARKPLLLIPPDMRAPFAAHTPEYARSFRLPPNVTVMAYSQLSMATSTDALERLRPDVLVCDEAHLLRNDVAARTKRVKRYLKEHPNTVVVVMSGTLTTKSIKDYAHLAEWALKHRSPCPRDWKTRESFAAVLDAKPTKGDGDSRFVAGAAPVDWSIYSPLFPEWQSYESTGLVEDPENPEDFVSPRVAEARHRWRDRLRHAPGVVATASSSCDASLYLIERPLEAPPVVKEMLARVMETWDRPDGWPMDDAIAVWRCGRQLSQGFYYRWKWPTEDRRPTEADKEWLRTRAAWSREVRRVVQRGEAKLDSPKWVGLWARKALRDEVDAKEDLSGRNPVEDDFMLLHALGEWVEHEHRRWGGKDTPPTETVWVDDFLVRDALRWMKEHPTGLVFYAEAAMAEALALAGVTIYGGGTNPEDLQGKRGAALSVNSHRQGKNLQKHHEALILSFEPHAGNMEQLLSRTHRAGQQEDEVRWWYYAHTEPAKQAILDARSKALYTQTTMGDRQRLCYANWIKEEGR